MDNVKREIGMKASKFRIEKIFFGEGQTVDNIGVEKKKRNKRIHDNTKYL